MTQINTSKSLKPLETGAPLKRFNPDMLKLAREFHGMTMQDLAKQIGVSPGFISQLEDGIRDPSEQVVQNLVSVLKFPTHHYYQEGRLESAHPSFYRKRVQISPLLLRRCAARMTTIKRNVEKLLSQMQPPEVMVPFLDPEEFSGGVKEVAQTMRRHLRIPPGPIRNLTELLEDAGCIIVPFDFGTRKIDGCSDWVAGHPIVFVNKLIPASRIRHTLSHELGHLVMHKFITDECEDQADYFSAEFNLPEGDIRAELAPVNLDRLARLKLKWKSSMQALLYRATQLGVISERKARYNWMLMRRYRYHELEPHEDMMPIEKPTAIQEMIAVFTGMLGFSKADLVEFLAIFEELFDEIYSDRPVLKVI